MKKLTLFLAVAVLFLANINYVEAGLLTTTEPGDLIFEVLSGEGLDSRNEFGIGIPGSFFPVFNDIRLLGGVSNVDPSPIVNLGYYPSGSQLDFYLYTFSSPFGTDWAFSSNLDSTPTASDLVVFSDTNNSLGYGGSIIETVGVNSWILHMDNAVSYCCDDDDNEIVMSVFIDTSSYTPVPEPTTILLLASGLVGLAGVRKRLWRHEK